MNGPSLGRLTAFLLLVVTAELWAHRHLGYGLTNPGRLGELAAVVTGVVALLNRAFDKGRFDPVLQKLRQAAGALLARPVLLVGWAVFLYLAATRSSVTVLTPEGEPPRMQLEALDPGYASSRPDTRPGFGRFRVSVNPLGTPFRLRAQGFVPVSFDVPPLVGRTVRLEDLRKSPSLLVRPSLLAIRELEKGCVVVRKDGATGAIIATSRGPTSVVVGPRRPVPSTSLEEWKLELESQGVVGQPAATALLAWQRTRYEEPLIDLEPGMTLYARAVTEGGTPLAEGRITLGNEPLLEMSLVDLPAGSGESHVEDCRLP